MIRASVIGLLLGTTAAPSGGTPDRLTAQTALVAITATKVYPNKAPESPAVQPPYITVRRSSNRHLMVLSGTEGSAAPRLLITAHHLTANACDALADLIRQLLNGYATPSWQSATPRIKGMFLEDDGDDWDADIYGGELGVHTVQMTFKVWHTET